MWELLNTGIKTAEENMQLDRSLLEKLSPQGPAILHLYRWKTPSATYGHFIKPHTLLNLEAAQKHHLALAKRPTGGGMIFHVSDLAFSVLMPAQHEKFSENTLENYHYINHKVLVAVQSVMKEASIELLPEAPAAVEDSCQNFCMAHPTIFDVMIGNKKIAGAAQRQRKQGFLHQGSISIAMPDERLLEEVLLPDTQVLKTMKAHTLLQGVWSLQDLEEIRAMLEKHLTRVFLEGSP